MSPKRQHTPSRGRPGRVVETVGRRVRVSDAEGERVCVLSGQRAVIGDRVSWEEVQGEGGKLLSVERRDTALRRVDPRGREQVLAANLSGLLIVQSAQEPGFRAALLDRYLVTASVEGLRRALCLTKLDLGVPPEVEREIALRADDELPVLRASPVSGEGMAQVLEFLAEVSRDGPWALVGGSGVGKTSLTAALLPDEEVGPIAGISEYWGTGRHTTTASRLFALPGGGEIADSPGIRNFTPSLGPEDVRDHFPVLRHVRCRYRDCLHRPDEDGCTAEQEVDPALMLSYRTLLGEVVGVYAAQQAGRRG